MKIRTAVYLINLFFVTTLPLFIFSESISNITDITVDTIDNDQDKAAYLIDFAKSISDANPNAAIEISKNAINYIPTNDTSGTKADINLNMGELHYLTGDYQHAITYYKEALRLNENNKPIASQIMIYIANCYIEDNNPSKAHLYYNSAYTEAISLNDTELIVKSLVGLGNYFVISEKLITADSTFRSAYSFASQINNNNLLAIAGYNTCRSNILLNKNNTDSLIFSTITTASISKNIEDDLLILQLASDYFISKGKHELANSYLKKAVLLLEQKHAKILGTYSNNASLSSKKAANYYSTFTITIYIVSLLLLILLIITILKFRRKNKQLDKNLKNSTNELSSFEDLTLEKEEEISVRTKDRIEEIKQEIGQNTNTEIALRETIGNLEQVNYLKDMFLSKLSHDIRTPLNGILGFASLLESQLALLEHTTLFEYANNISESGSGLVTLLNNLLDISRLDSDTFHLSTSNYNTNELIQNVVDNYSTEAKIKNLKLVFDSKPIPDIITDNTIFTKILSLIIDNSVKFTEKGFIKISYSYDEKLQTISIIIVDTGIGIDKAYIKQVFEPYRQESLGYSTSYQGAGLGLPLARKMTEKLGGTIIIESEKGKGTIITITLPTKMQHNIAHHQTTSVTEKPVIVPKTKENNLPWKELSILVVEDDNFNQILYRKMLKSAHHLDVAMDGKSALNLIEKMDKLNSYQLILMDINLPGKYDGIELMKEIRKQYPDFINIPFIAQTAFAISGNREKMLQEGFDEYITKPIIKSTLAKTIKKVCAG